MKEVQFLSSAGAVRATRVFLPTAEQRAQAYSILEARQLVRQLRSNSNHAALVALHELATGIPLNRSSRMRESVLIAPIESAIESGRILLTKGWPFGQQDARAEGSPEAHGVDASLIKAIMGDQDALVFEGRRYRLTTKLRSRRNVQDGYRAMGAGVEAAALMARMAESLPTTPEERAQWAEAVALEGKPGDRQGLTLWCHAPSARGATRASDQPAMTPSQLRPKTASEDWIEIEIVYEDGVAFAGNCVVELPGGRSTEGPPDADGLVRIDSLTPGTCKVELPALDAAVFAMA